MPDTQTSVLSLLHDGEILGSVPSQHLNGHLSIARRLGKAAELRRHAGCVNRLSFATDANLLASASDDTTVCIWDVASYSFKARVPTEHTLNLFGVRFMPHSDNEYVATGSMDWSVRVTHVETHMGRSFVCHQNRVKSVEVDQNMPQVILSSSEDGTVRLFDTRERHLQTPDSPEDSNVLIRLKDPPSAVDSPGLKAASLNPMDSHMLIVASDAVRIFDRRVLPCSTSNPADGTAAVLELCPSHLVSDAPERSDYACAGAQACATHAAFSDCGTRAVASFSGDHVYVFDVCGTRSRGCSTLFSQRMQRIRPSVRASRVDRLLRGAKASLASNLHSSSIYSLSQVLGISPGNVVALYLHSEALLRRGWISDHRAALTSTHQLRKLIESDSSKLAELIDASCSCDVSGSMANSFEALNDSKKSKLGRLWRAVLDIQLAAAVFGIIVPRGLIQFSSRWNRRRADGVQNKLAESRLKKLRDLIREARHQLETIQAEVHRMTGCQMHLRDLSAWLYEHRVSLIYQNCIVESESRLLKLRKSVKNALEVLRNDMAVTKVSTERSRRHRPVIDSAREDTPEDQGESMNLMPEVTVCIVHNARSGRLRRNSDWEISRSSAGTSDVDAISEQSNVARELEGRNIDEVFAEGREDDHDDQYRSNVGLTSAYTNGAEEANFSRSEMTEGEASGVIECSRREEDEKVAKPYLVERDADLESLSGESIPDDLSEEADEDLILDEDTLSVSSLKPEFWADWANVGYGRRFVGHRNVLTDIKEASFYGSLGQCILSGSDDGYMYVWCASTGRILSRLKADQDIVNCVQPAPQTWGGGLVASSGIDHDVKLWTPHEDEDSTASFDCQSTMEDAYRENYAHASENSDQGVLDFLRGSLRSIDVHALQEELSMFSQAMPEERAAQADCRFS